MKTERNPYLFLFRDTNWMDNLPVEKVERVMADYAVWMETITKQGKLLGGKPLLPNVGRIVRGSAVTGEVSDGPFIESKEVIGGYMLIKADSLEEAVEIAKGFPPVAAGQSVEVRETLPECPAMQILRDRQLAEAAVPA